jgi:hypothetical protein
MRWAGDVARMEAKRNSDSILPGKQEGKRPLVRPRRRWMKNIKMDLREIGWGGMDWIDVSQDRRIPETLNLIAKLSLVAEMKNYELREALNCLKKGAAERTPRFGRGVATNHGVLSAALCI